MLLEEGMRRAEYPHIDFRSTPMGRLAYVEGSRVEVWFADKAYQDYKKDVEATAKHFGWPVHKVQAVIRYAEAFRAETDQAKQDSYDAEDRLKELLPDLAVSKLPAGE